jgi:hypothetical protein
MERKQLAVAVLAAVGRPAAALSLLRAGVDVHVYERVRTLSEVGAGVQISPTASASCMGWASPTRWRGLAA